MNKFCQNNFSTCLIVCVIKRRIVWEGNKSGSVYRDQWFNPRLDQYSVSLSKTLFVALLQSTKLTNEYQIETPS